MVIPANRNGSPKVFYYLSQRRYQTMLCPFCQTENRDDQELCYHCNKDLTMLRLIVNKAKHHYNQGLEYAERGRTDEAIQELTNALELDSSLVNGYVVLGTLYAKREEFEEARKYWNQALALDHRYQKVHDYLGKAEGIESIFPTLQRLQQMSILFAALLGVALIGLIYLSVALMNRPAEVQKEAAATVQKPSVDPAMEAIFLATEMLSGSENDWSQARAVLASVNKDELTTLSQRAIGNLEATLDRIGGEQVALADRTLAADEPALAVEILDGLAKKHPGRAVSQQIAAARLRVDQYSVDRLKKLGDSFTSGTLSIKEYEAQAGSFLKILSEGAEKQEMAKAVSNLRTEHRKQQLSAAETAITSGPLSDAIGRTRELRSEDPASTEMIDRLIDRRLEKELAATADAVTSLTAAGNLAAAADRVRSLAAAYEAAERPAPIDLLKAMQAQIDAVTQRKVMAELQTAFKAEKWRDVIEQTEAQSGLPQGETEQAEIKKMREEAIKAFVAQEWRWLSGRTEKFETAKISDDEAKRTFAGYRILLENLPDNLKDSRGRILFDAAVAQLKMGDPKAAKTLLSQIRQESPQSDIIPLVEKFTKAHAKELEPEAATATPAQP